MPLTPGTRLGPYDIVGPLGAGGMGEVYRAHDPKLNRDVAIKILPDVFARDADRVARFSREAQTLAALNHPNIAQIYGIVDAADPAPGSVPVHALVMELVEGEDLSEAIARGPLPLGEALAIARQVADALEAAHDQGVIHRDLKPANIKVRPDGAVKVLDFGLAKALGPVSDPRAESPGAAPRGASGGLTANSPTVLSPAMTAMGMIVGTASYMAPEQARAKPVDRRADVWAFGAVLYEMLTGRRAFPGDDISDVLAAVLKTEPDWTLVPVSAPPSVRRLLRRCLEKDPRKRLSAIGDARLELDESTETPQPAGGAAPRRSGPVAWLLVLTGAAAVVAATAFVTATLYRPTAPAGATRLSIVAPSNSDFFPDTREAAISPDGRVVAFVTGAPSGLEASQLWLREIGALDARRVEGAEGAHLPFWSPDSRRVGFFKAGKLSTVATDGGRVSVLCDAPDGRGGTWSSSGVIVFAPNNGGPLLRVSADGGEPSAATTLDASRKETGHRFPAFLPDGRHFLFASIPAVNSLFDIFIGSVDGTEPVRLLSAESTPVYAEPGYLVFSRKGVAVAQTFNAAATRLEGDPIALDDAPGGIGFQYLAGPAVTASARALVYLRDPYVDTRLLWIDSDGRELAVVDSTPARYNELRLAPDDQRAAVVRASSAQHMSIWVHDLIRRGATRIAEGRHVSYSVVWSADGKRVVYANDDSGRENLFIRDAGGVTPAEPFFSSETPFKTPNAWSPDGKFLLFTQLAPETQNDLLLISASPARTLSTFLKEPSNETLGRFSPDGRWVAYVSDETGSSDVYVRSFPVPNRKYRVTTDGGTWVSWKRDGTALLLVGANGRQLKRAEVRATGAELSVGVPRLLGTLPSGTLAWDSSGDLQRLLVSVPTNGNPGLSLTVVSDWVSALRKR